MMGLLIFGLAWIIQIGYWMILRRGFERVEQHQIRPNAPENLPPISVIISARNEAKNLPHLLEALAAQTHPDVEIVVVNDASTDDTAPLLTQAQNRLKNLTICTIDPAEHTGKKQALTRAIDMAQHDLLAFTDADCTPPRHWLQRLAEIHAIQSNTVIVGYGPMIPAKGFLNRFVRYETLLTAYFTASALGLKRPYMAVGRNLSYPRKIFNQVDGFSAFAHYLSGDDDLFIQEVARMNVGQFYYPLDAGTFVPSPAPATWRAWFRQKRRHTSTGRVYRRDIQQHLTLFHLTNLLVWLAPLLGWTGLVLLGAKLIFQHLSLWRPAQYFRATDLLRFQAVLELGYVLYNTLVAPLGVFRKPKNW